jgi:hypothetical protein
MKGGPVTWEGKTRPVLTNQDVVPHLESGPFPVWIGVGGNPQSVIRAARYGFSLMLAIIGGSPARFAPFSQLFREALESFGRASWGRERRPPRQRPDRCLPDRDQGPELPRRAAQEVRRQAATLHDELGTWVTPVICIDQRRQKPFRHDRVWIVPRRQTLDWIRSRSGHALSRGASQKVASRNRASGSHVQKVRSAPDLSDEGVTRFGGRFAFSVPGGSVPLEQAGVELP